MQVLGSRLCTSRRCCSSSSGKDYRSQSHMNYCRPLRCLGHLGDQHVLVCHLKPPLLLNTSPRDQTSPPRIALPGSLHHNHRREQFVQSSPSLDHIFHDHCNVHHGRRFALGTASRSILAGRRTCLLNSSLDKYHELHTALEHIGLSFRIVSLSSRHSSSRKASTRYFCTYHDRCSLLAGKGLSLGSPRCISRTGFPPAPLDNGHIGFADVRPRRASDYTNPHYSLHRRHYSRQSHPHNSIRLQKGISND